jgi:carbamoyl-phosphate synthase small subunit
MLCLTWPLVGNYGINQDDMESPRVQVAALLVKECCAEPSNWLSTESLPAFLARHNVPGVEGLDTRALTLRLREKGALRGAISTSILDPAVLADQARRLNLLTGYAAPAEPYAWDAAGVHGGRPVKAALQADGSYSWPVKHATARLVAYDFGIRWSTLRSLAVRGMDLLVVPPTFSFGQVSAVKPDGIFLSGGPGDPSALSDVSQTIAKLAETYPLAAAGLGHQLLAIALGGKTAKLKRGHHGVNYPIQDLRTGTFTITSQHHEFHVLPDGLQGLIISHVNANDQSVEGLRHPDKPILSIQHLPDEAFFDRFVSMLTGVKA